MEQTVTVENSMNTIYSLLALVCILAIYGNWTFVYNYFDITGFNIKKREHSESIYWLEKNY